MPLIRKPHFTKGKMKAHILFGSGLYWNFPKVPTFPPFSLSLHRFFQSKGGRERKEKKRNNLYTKVLIISAMKVSFFSFLVILFSHNRSGFCKSEIRVGYTVTLAVPIVYSVGFIGRAFLMETDQKDPNFKAALSVEPIRGRYSCSLEVFLGDVKVWNSGHYSQFYTSDVCILELTKDGDLQLRGPKNRVGWRSGTSGQGVERLQILKTGNLVLVDDMNRIKWQSFNFPTDVMLWGQRLNVATRLTSFPTNSTSFYSFEIRHEKIALYLCSGKQNYSYWEFKPSMNRNISYIVLGSKGLQIFNDEFKRITRILPWKTNQPLRFLALGNQTGNLGIYSYSPDKQQFEAAFQALATTCDLPLACKPYGICTLSNACSCIRLLTKKDKTGGSDCSEGFSGGFCGEKDGDQVEMLELSGVSSDLRDAPKRVNVSKEACAESCLDDCECAAALYASKLRECFVYGMVAGAKQVEKEITGFTYMVKVPKGTHWIRAKSGVKKWVLILVGVLDGLIILLVFGGLGYYLIQKRRKNIRANDSNS